MAGMPAVQKALVVSYLDTNWNTEQRIADRQRDVDVDRDKMKALGLALAEAQQRQREAEIEVKRAKVAAAHIKVQLADAWQAYEASCLRLDHTKHSANTGSDVA